MVSSAPRKREKKVETKNSSRTPPNTVPAIFGCAAVRKAWRAVTTRSPPGPMKRSAASARLRCVSSRPKMRVAAGSTTSRIGAIARSA
jgi:hypothetical protein